MHWIAKCVYAIVEQFRFRWRKVCKRHIDTHIKLHPDILTILITFSLSLHRLRRSATGRALRTRAVRNAVRYSE